jgi:hypothetical protein
MEVFSYDINDSGKCRISRCGFERYCVVVLEGFKATTSKEEAGANDYISASLSVPVRKLAFYIWCLLDLWGDKDLDLIVFVVDQFLKPLRLGIFN